MKKLLSLVLVLSMVLGSFGMAFAAPTSNFEDIVDADVAKAVERLIAFDIVQGYEDGTFRPENTITRAEFATLMVRALGLGDLATPIPQGGRVPSQFTDMETHWAVEYAEVAAGEGVIRGDVAGTFRPNDPVTYAEALTMLVRALGYSDDLIGATPTNWRNVFTARAAQVGITSGVRVSPNDPANRGTVSVLLNNTLDTEVIKQVTFGNNPEWEEQAITLLEEKLDIVKLEEVVVISTPKVNGSIEMDQLEVEYARDIFYSDSIRTARRDIYKEAGETDIYDVIADMDIDQLLGLSLNAYINDDEEIIYVEESSRPFRVMYDVIDHDEVEVNNNGQVTEIELINASRSYDVQTEDVVFYVDNERVTHEEFVELAENGNNELFAKVVLNRRGNVRLIDAHQWDGGSPFVVTSANEDQITYFDTNEDDDRRIRKNSYDNVVIFDTEGNLMEMEDLRADDVIYINNRDLDGDNLEEASSGDEVAYILVVRNTVEGRLESYRANADYTRVFEVEVDGRTYNVIQHGNRTTVSIDNDDTIELVIEAEEDLDDLSAVEADVVLLLDAAGDVRHIRGGIESSSRDQYGVITATDSRFGDTIVKLLNENEDVVEYELDLDRQYGYGDKIIEAGDIVRFTVNSNGDINEIQLLAYREDGVFVEGDEPDSDARTNIVPSIDNADTGRDITRNSIRLDGRFTSVKDDVKVFNYGPALELGNDYEDVEATDWNSIVGKTITENTVVLTAMDTRRDAAEAVVFLSGFDSIGDDAFVGYVTSIRRIDGDGYADIVVQGSDTPVRFELHADSQYDAVGGFERRALVGFTERSNGKVVADFDHEDFEFHTGKVGTIRGNYITLVEENGDSIATVRVNSDTVYYEKGSSRVYNDISEDDYIRVAVNEGVVGAVKIYDINERDVAAGTGGEVIWFFNDYNFDNNDDLENIENRWETDSRETRPGDGDDETVEEGTVTGFVYAASGSTVSFEITEAVEGFEVGEVVDFVITADTELVDDNYDVRTGITAIRATMARLVSETDEYIFDVTFANENEATEIFFRSSRTPDVD